MAQLSKLQARLDRLQLEMLTVPQTQQTAVLLCSLERHLPLYLKYCDKYNEERDRAQMLGFMDTLWGALEEPETAATVGALPEDIGPRFDDHDTNLDQLAHGFCISADAVRNVACGKGGAGRCFASILEGYLVLLDIDHTDEPSYVPDFSEFDEGASATFLVEEELSRLEADAAAVADGLSVNRLRERARRNRVDPDFFDPASSDRLLVAIRNRSLST
jgi:hypothetical protein